MLKNEDIIKRLSVEEKIDLLLIKNSKNPLGEYNIELEKLEEVISSISNIVIYKNNVKNVNYNVIKSFKKEVFTNIMDVVTTENSTLKLFKTEDDLEAYSLLKKDYSFILSKDTKTLSKNILNKINKSKEMAQQASEEIITNADLIMAKANNEIILEEDIDLIIDRVLGMIVPLIETIENPNLETKEGVVDKDFFSLKAKRVTLFLFAIYYNIMMYFVFGHATIEIDPNSKNYIIGFWLFINLIFLVIGIRLRNKKVVQAKTPIEDISTFDFEVVEPTKHEVVISNTNFKQIDLKELVDSFYLFLLDNGLMLEYKKIRELFSAMASSHLVVINNKSNLNKEFLGALNKFFGNSTFYKELDSNVSSEVDIYFDEDNASGFIKGICNANDNVSNINITSLLNVDLDSCDTYLNSVLKFVKNPNEKGYITLDSKDYSINDYIEGRRLPIPKNTWFVLFTKENSKQIITSNVVNDSIIIDVNVIEVERKELAEELSIISAVNFLDAINTSREDKFLSNGSWEKIDEFEKYLNAKFNFSIENKTVRKLEVYASVYNATSDDESLSLDSAISNVLLPIVFYKQDSVYTIVLDALKEVFDDEKILLTKENLVKYK